MLRVFFHLPSVFSFSKLFLPFEIFSSCCCMNSLPCAYYILYPSNSPWSNLPTSSKKCIYFLLSCFFVFFLVHVPSARVLKHLQCIFFLQSEIPGFIPILTLPMLCYMIHPSVCQSYCCYLVPLNDLRWQEVAFLLY